MRVVTQLHVKNTAQGGWEIEAIADRTDLSATEERWTITIIPFGGNDTLTKVLVNGMDAYALERSGPFNDPVLTLTTPSDSATVRASDGASGPNAIPFSLLVQNTESDRHVAIQVVLLAGQFSEPSELTTCQECCVDTYPQCDPEAAPTILEAYECCITNAFRIAFLFTCTCDTDCDPDWCDAMGDVFLHQEAQNCANVVLYAYAVVAHEWRTQGIAGTMSGGKDSLSWPIIGTPNSSSVTPSVS